VVDSDATMTAYYPIDDEIHNYLIFLELSNKISGQESDNDDDVE